MACGPLNLDLLRLRPQYDVACLLARQHLNKPAIEWTILKEGVMFDATPLRPLPLQDVQGSKCPVPFAIKAKASTSGALPILRDSGLSVVVLRAVIVIVPVSLFDCPTNVLHRAWTHCCAPPL